MDSRLDDSSVFLDAGGIESSKQTIVVLQSYVTMFDHVLARAFMQGYPGEGVIITGQPGIGVFIS